MLARNVGSGQAAVKTMQNNIWDYNYCTCVKEKVHDESKQLIITSKGKQLKL